MARYIYTKTNKRLLLEVLDDTSSVRTNSGLHEVFTGTKEAFIQKADLEGIEFNEDQFEEII